MSFMILCPLLNSIQTSKESFETTHELYASAPNIAHLLKKLSKAYICLSYNSHRQLLSHLKQHLYMSQLLLSYNLHRQLLSHLKQAIYICLSYYSATTHIGRFLNAAAVTPKKTPSVP